MSSNAGRNVSAPRPPPSAKRVPRSAPAQNAVPAPVTTTARRSRCALEQGAQVVAVFRVECVATFGPVDRGDTDVAVDLESNHDSSMSAIRSPS